MTLLLALIVAQVTYEERARAVDEVIVAERLRIASVFEGIKAWGWAREEYRKVLRLAPESDVARKLSGSGALPTANVKGLLAQRYHDLTDHVSKVAAAKHAELARWCQENGQREQATAHWRWTLLYSPLDGDAIQALGFAGSGASLRSPLWKHEPWKSLDAFDPGKDVPGQSVIETKWDVKTLSRRSSDLEFESLGLSEEHVANIVRQAGGVLSLLRDALGDPAAMPYFKRYVFFGQHRDYAKYIDDFTSETDARKEILKTKAGGHWNKEHSEYAQWAPDKSDRHERVLAGHVAITMLQMFMSRNEPDWLLVGTGATMEMLFTGTCEVSYYQIPEGTQDGEVREANPDKWQADLLALARNASDPPLEILWSMRVNAMKPVHAVKCTSVVRFLLTRWPHLYRSLVLAQRDVKAIPRSAAEGALGMTIEELDEFWRRWILAH